MSSQDTRMWQQAWQNCFRVKPISFSRAEDLDSQTSANLPELVQLGLATVLPLALFIQGSEVTAYVAGPSSCLSVIVAVLAAAMTGLCYAELRSRWPRLIGPAYEFIFSASGELLAWIVAWLSILLHVCLISGVGRAVSADFDALISFRILNTTASNLGKMPGLDSSPDLLASFLIMIATVLVSMNFRQPRIVLGVANVVTMVITLFALVVGLFHIHFNLWADSGDFFQHGLQGTLEGAAVFFYVFTSFDAVLQRNTQTSRDVKRPLVAVGCCYVITSFFLIGVCSITGLLVPWQQLESEATWAESFMEAGLEWMRFMIGIPAIPILLVTIWSSFRSAADQIDVLSTDGLVFSFMQWRPREDAMLMAPIIAVGLLSLTLAMLINLQTLLECVSACSLFIFTIATFSLFIVRYKPLQKKLKPIRRKKKRRKGKNSHPSSQTANKYGSFPVNSELRLESDHVTYNTEEMSDARRTSSNPPTIAITDITPVPAGNAPDVVGTTYPASSDSDDVDEAVEDYKYHVHEYRLNSCGLPYAQLTLPDVKSQRRAVGGAAAYFITFFLLSIVLTHAGGLLRQGSLPVIFIIVFLLSLLALTTLTVAWQPQNLLELQDLAVNVPFVPWLPLMSLTFNSHLLARLSLRCWIIILIWLFIGFLIYIIYGSKHSKAEHEYSLLPDEHSGLIPTADDNDVSPSSSINPSSNDNVTAYNDDEDDDVVILDTLSDVEMLDP